VATEQRRLPLAGIRVADFSRVVAGPYGTYLLARMGAEVIKVEGVNPLDHTREVGPYSDTSRNRNRSGYFNSVNGAKRSVTLHLHDAAQAVLAREIALASDIVIESFMEGTMERFGLGYESLAQAKPGIVMVSCSGFGRTGPMKSHSAYMNTVAAYIGLTALNGNDDELPMPVGATFSDLVAGTTAAFAALLALRRARSSGRGRHIDLSMAEASMALMGQPFMAYFANGTVPLRQGNGFTTMAPCNAYPCKGGDKWIAIAISSDAEWERLVGAMGSPVWAISDRYSTVDQRLENRTELDARIAAWTPEYDNLDLAQRLQAAGVPALPSSDPEDLTLNPHLLARGVLAIQDYVLEPNRLLPNLPWHFANHGQLDDNVPPPPTLGEDNREILATLTTAPDSLIQEIEERALTASGLSGGGIVARRKDEERAP
jgi:benzylsuccinate CoA-transferase BbsF subunit